MRNNKEKSSVTFTPEDKRLIAALSAKLGVKQGVIIVLGIRALAEKEGVR